MAIRQMGIWQASVALAVAVAWPGVGAAAPLDSETCDRLKSEQIELIGAGVKADMQRGPDWAKSNLPAERLQRVVRLIEVEQQVLFRCPSAAARADEEERRKAVEVKKAAEAEAAEKAAAKAAEPAAQPAAKAEGQEKAQPAKQAVPKAKERAGANAKAKEKTKTKAKQTKAPSNDAYSPGSNGKAAAGK